MFTKELFFLFLIIFLLIVAIGITIFKQRESFSKESKELPDCICAFDIDGTITCGLDRAARAISKCKERGCKIAINTARPTKWFNDLDLKSLGLHVTDFDSDFYNGEPFKCSFTDIKCFEDTIANTKVKHLHTLSTKWNVNPQRIILFDDQYSNIEMAKQAGFSVIFANHHLTGLPDNVEILIDNILNK
jgi:hypothetical protein